MRKNIKSSSIVAVLKKLGTRAALLLLAWLMLRPGKKKQVALMIKEATLGGHQIKHSGFNVFITPTAWIERRRNLIAQGVITEIEDKFLFSDKAKRGGGPRAFTIDGREVLAITADYTDLKTKQVIHGVDYQAVPTTVHMEDTEFSPQVSHVDFVYREIPYSYVSRPIIRSFLLPSPVSVGGSRWLTLDHRTREGAAAFEHLMAQGWNLHAWSARMPGWDDKAKQLTPESIMPCLLTDDELEELELLDMVYRVCVDMGLQQQKSLAKSDKRVQTLAAIEQDRTKGGVAEFSGRPDDGMEGFMGGGLTYARHQETGELIMANGEVIQFETPAWSMAEENVTLNGYVVPQRPDVQQFTLDLAWGWNCRLDLTKQMVVVRGEQGEEIWLDTRDPAFREMAGEVTNRMTRISVLKVEPVQVESRKQGPCTVRTVKGRPKRIEPIGLIRRHLHNLMQMGNCTYILRPYLCKHCNGTGMAAGIDPDTGATQLDDQGQPLMGPCVRCKGSGCGAPGYHIDYRTGLATPNVTGAKVIKSAQFACKGKKGKPCGNLEFMTDIHAEVCTRCGAEMWKNSMIVLFSSQDTSDAFELPEEATHGAVQVYGALVKDMIRSRINRVRAYIAAGKVVPPTIGTKVVMGKHGLMPNILDSMRDLEFHPPVLPIQGCELPPVKVPTQAEWALKYALEDHKEHMEMLHVEISDGTVLRRLRKVASAMRDKRKAKATRAANMAKIVGEYRKWSKQFQAAKAKINKELGR